MWPDQLSLHFSLQALVASSDAEELGIDNTPPDALAGNAVRLAASLETARDYLSKQAGHEVPLIPSSGYRCALLNAKVGGAPTSEHRDFRACDFHPGAGLDLLQAFDWLRLSGLVFDQLIYEHDGHGDFWIHWGIEADGDSPRQEVLKGIKTDSGSSYVELT